MRNPTPTWTRRDAWIGGLLALLAATASFRVAHALPDRIVDTAGYDVWFESDAPRVFDNMSSRWSDHYRAKVHPLFSLEAFAATALLRSTLGVGPLEAARYFMAVVEVLWVLTLFGLLRLMGCRRADAVLFTLLAAVSASAMFWFIVPETSALGSLTILLACGVAVLAHSRAIPTVWYVMASAATLSVTITNWMAGIFAAATTVPWRRALRISAWALGLVVVLWAAEKRLFPTTGMLFDGREERQYLLPPPAAPSAASAFLFHSIVMPQLTIEGATPSSAPWPMLRTQRSAPGSGSAWGRVAVGLWTLHAGLGARAVWERKPRTPLQRAWLLTLAGQFLLHLVYGRETFLYSLHFMPLLVVAAASATLSRLRPAAVALTVALIVCVGINNVRQLSAAVALLR